MRTLFLIIAISIVCFIVQSCENDITKMNDEIGNWIKVESGVNETLYDVDFTDCKNGWIVGDSGTILHTENGGQSWRKQSCVIKGFLLAVDFVDNYYGWVCGKDSILHTKDGGETWQLQYFQDLEEGYFRDIKFINNQIGFTIGGYGDFGVNGILLRTDDNGKSWKQLYEIDLPTLTKISINEHYIWICGFGGTILLSEDEGLTWQKKFFKITPPPSFSCIQFVDFLHGWVSSRDDYLGFYMTIDGGEKWIRISENTFKIIGGVKSFYFIDKNIGWMCNFPFDRILKTIDGSTSWGYDSEIRQRINSFTFLQNGDGWAVGNNGGILQYLSNE